jgi:hypothetical protein
MSNDLIKRRFTNIRGTVFAGKGDRETSAYDNKIINPNKLQCALPHRLPSWLRMVRVFHHDKVAECIVNDVGPHCTYDDYWNREDGRPLAETHGKNEPHRAGIDLTPAVFEAFNASQRAGYIIIDWEFILPQKLPATKKLPTYA